MVVWAAIVAVAATLPTIAVAKLQSLTVAVLLLLPIADVQHLLLTADATTVAIVDANWEAVWATAAVAALAAATVQLPLAMRVA